jgi:TP901 family phage tail tape measure protein
MQYRDKILKLVEVVTLLNDLGIQLTGSNFQAAETANIKKAIAYINKGSAERGIDGVAMPDLSNVFDPAKLAKQLSGGSEKLAKIFDSPEAKTGISGALGHLIQNIASQFPKFIARYSDQFQMSESGGFQFKAPGGTAPAHYAVTDAAASLIVKDFVEEFGDKAATLLIPVAKDLNTKVQAAAGGGGGSGKGPTGGTAAGDKPEDDPFANRASKSLEKLLLVGKQYQQAVAGLTEAEIVKVNQRLEQLKKSETQAEILAKLAGLEKERFDILTEASEVLQGSSGFAKNRVALGDLSSQGPLTRQDDASVKRYNQQIIAATKLETTIRELTIAGQQNERQVISTVKEQARQGQVTEALTQNMRKEIDAKLQNAQAGKAATNSIKAQMQEQVNAQRAVQKQTQSLMQTWVTSRYALYDIGNFYQNVAQNLIRVSRQIFDTTESYRRFESSFTSVERAMQLTGTAALDMRNQFVLLSETIPVAFEEIARIGTLGAQMGIASDGIIGFTKTVSQFASITGISAETVAQQFGRIAELADVDPTEFDNLGSAVAFAGINAVATEAEILNLTQSIAAVSNQAGITAPEIVGIATALASVGIQSEQARGVFTRVLADIDRAARGGGESLQALSEVTGMSAETISSSWGTEGAANEVFIALLQGLDAADNLTAAFDKLNIVETREINTLTRLAKNLDVVSQALSDSNSSFEDATFLGTSFERTVDNLDSKITLFKNNLDSLAAALSSGFALVLGQVLDVGSEFLKFLKDAEDSILFKGVLPFAAVLTAFAAGLAAFSAVTAKVTAQVYAFRVAMVNMANNPTAVEGIVRQTKALMGLGSGLIEVRDQVSGINERGLIEPVNFNSSLTNVKKQQAELLKTKNIYLSMGDVAKETMDKETVRSFTSVQLARKEADAVNQLVLAKRLEIEALENSQNPADIAKAATMRQAFSQAYVVSVGGEIRILNALELQDQRNVISSSNLSRAKKAQALAHLDNATAINLETKAASNATGKIGSFLSRAVGIAAIVGTAVVAVDMLTKSFENMGKVDLLESGGGLESLKEAIKKDTLAVENGTMKAVATAEIEYAKYVKTTDSAAVAIKTLTGLSDDAAFNINKVTEEFEKQSIAIGENTKEWIANALYKALEEEDIEFTAIQKSMQELGMDFDTLLKDMSDAASGEDINPLRNLDSELDRLKARRDELGRESIKYTNSARPQAITDELTEIYSQISAYEDLKNVLSSLGIAFQEAFSKSSMWNAIKDVLDLSEAENGILALVDRFKEAQESGKGFKKVFADLKVSAIALTGATGDDLLEIKSQETLLGLRAVLQGMLEAAKAASILEVRTIKASKALVALKAADKLEIESIEDAIASLDAIILALGTSVESVGGATETMAEKIARLLDEASSGTEKVAAFRNSIRALGKAMAESTSFNLNEALGATNISALLDVIDSIGARSGSVNKTVRDLQIFKLVLQDMKAPGVAIKQVEKALESLGGSTNITKKRAALLRREFANLFNTFQTNFTAGAAEITSDVENKVKSLTDYVGELGNVLRSTFDIRYGNQTALDALTGAWLGLTEAASQAEDAVKNANNEINQSVADRTVLQYQLSVAERYKDEKRSVSLRAKLAELDQKIVEQNKQLSEANDAASTSLTGNSKAAIDNRAKVRDLVTQYNSYLIALANTNMNSTDLNAEAAKLETEFMNQAKALGFAEEELKSYTQAFKGDFTKVINGIPRDITLTVNTDPALRAIQEFVAQAKAALSQISITAPAGPVTLPGQKPTEQFFNLPGLTNTRPGPEIDGKKGDIVTGPKGATWAWDNKNKKWDKIAKKAMGGYISGPGSATSDSIPAMVSNGEYVIQARAVSAYGLDFMNALNQQRVGFSPMQGSSAMGGGGSSVVYLSPEDRALLRAAVDRPIALYTENTKIAQSANAGNVVLAQRGSN